MALMALIYCCVAAEAHDDDALYSPTYAACIKASGGVTFDLGDCIRGELFVQDRKLNEAYRTIQKTLSKERRDQLTGLPPEKWSSLMYGLRALRRNAHG